MNQFINIDNIHPRRIVNETYNRCEGQKRRRNNEKKKLESSNSNIFNPNYYSDDVVNDNNNCNDEANYYTSPDSSLNLDGNNYFNQENNPYMFTNFEGGGGGNDFYDIGEDLDEESLDEDDEDDNNSNNNDDIVGLLVEENSNDHEDDDNDSNYSSDSNKFTDDDNIDNYDTDSDYNGSFHLKYNLNNIVKTMEINNSKKINNNNKFTNKNHQQMLFKEDANTSTVLDLFTFIKSIIAEYGCSLKMERDLFHGIRKYALSSDSPFHNFFVSNTEWNEISDIHTAKFDVCADCGGTVFVGDMDYKKQCNKCNSQRYHPCSICLNKRNNNNIINVECKHKKRTSRKVIHYNYIIPSIMLLIQKDGFHNCCINYDDGFYKYNNGGSYNKESSFIRDTSDGKAYMIAMDQINTQFEKFKSNKTLINGYVIDENTVQVKLLLSLFYDGVQVYKSKVVSCSPLTITILNMPPNLRTMQGVGTFMLSAFTSIVGSEAETFLFNNCLMEEICMLEKGYAVSLGGVTYLMQGRLIQFLFDLPQLDKSLQVRVLKSKSGNGLCKGSYGITRCQRIVYSDLRNHFPWKHILRTLGQTSNCCPPNYYDNDINDIQQDETYYEDESELDIKEKSIRYDCTGRAFYSSDAVIDINLKNEIVVEFNKDLIGPNRKLIRDTYSTRKNQLVLDMKHLNELKQSCSREEYSMKISQYKSIRFPSDLKKEEYDDSFLQTRRVTDMDLRLVSLYFTPCDVKNADSIKDFLFIHPEKEEALWYNKNVPMELFTQYGMYYEHANYQEQVKIKRKTSKFYKKCAEKLDKLNVDCYQGVKGKFFGHKSKLVKIELHVNVDPTHTISNLMKRYRQYWMGERIEYNKANFIELMRRTKCHPCIYRKDANYAIPWKIDKRDQGIIDAIVNSISVPMGMREEFEVRSIFVYINMLKFNVLLDIICVLMPIIMMFSNLSPTYKAFFMMFSNVMCKFTSPIIDKSEIDDLHNEILEVASLHQGLFPQTEHNVVVDDLILLAQHIKNAGIWKGWASISGERFHQSVTSKVGRGGSSYDVTMSNKYYKQENLKLRTFFDFNIIENENMDDNNNNNNGLSINSNSDNMTFKNIIKNNRDLIIRNYKNKNSIFYNPFRMLVYDANKTLQTKVFTDESEMDEFECSDLLSCLIKEIMKATRNFDEAKSKSNLFKLYVKHQEFKQQYGSTWYKKLINTHIYEVVMYFHDFLLLLLAIHMSLVDNEPIEQQFLVLYSEQCLIEITNLINDEVLIDIDSLGILLKSLCNCFGYKNSHQECIVGESALIYGRRFLCRGFGSQKKSRDSNNDYANDMNDLRNNWKKKYYFRSFCKFRYSSRLKDNTHNDPESYNIHHPDKNKVGIINFFMRLELPNEPLLNGIKFASMTSFQSEKKEVWNSASVNEKYQTYHNFKAPTIDVINFSQNPTPKYRDTYRFVAFTDILPSQYGCFGLDQNNKPFPQMREQTCSKKVKDYLMPNFSLNNYTFIQTLYLFPLKPERLNIVYDKANTTMYNE